jgi:hypothetical protein
MRKALALTGLAAALLLASMASSAAAAPLVDRFHGKFSDTFAGDLCGIQGTYVITGMDNIQVFADGRFKDEFRQNVLFTSASTGKSVLIFAANQFVGRGPIDNGDGTISFLSTYKGLPEKIKLPNGRMLARDVGNVTFVDTFDATTGEFLGETTLERGPHPLLDSGFSLVCATIVPALS